MSPKQVKAKQIFKKELFNGTRLTEFRYEYKFDPKVSTARKFDIICANHELELLWSIEIEITWDDASRYPNDRKQICKWEKINLQKCNESIHGNYFVKGDDGFIKGRIETATLPLERKVWEKIECKEDCVITFEVAVYREDERVNSTIEDFTKLLENKSFCDVTFVIGDEEIPAHKFIVSARSEVLATMFESDMLEKETGRVEIVDIEPSIFRQLLRYIYSGKVETNDTDELLELIVAADKYSLKSLVNACAFNISCNLSADNVVEILIIADFVRAEFLKKDCINFFIEEMRKVFDTKAYKKMRRTHSDLVCQIFDCMVENSLKYDPLNRVAEDWLELLEEI